MADAFKLMAVRIVQDLLKAGVYLETKDVLAAQGVIAGQLRHQCGGAPNLIEVQVLVSLRDHTRPAEWYIGFSHLEDDTGLPRDFVRAACRSLTDRGMATYRSGLQNEDGDMAGSGYAITQAGLAYLDEPQAVDCPDCGGKDKAAESARPSIEDCPTCNGRGVYDSFDEAGRAHEMECYACGGSGRRKEVRHG